MAGGVLKLTILSPEKILFEGNVSRVLLPGEKDPFVVLHNHAPIISSLVSGDISWQGAEVGSIAVKGGFVEVKDNVVTACVEVQKI